MAGGLKEERAKEGLSIDDETLDEMVEKEEKRRDFLEERKKKRVRENFGFLQRVSNYIIDI